MSCQGTAPRLALGHLALQQLAAPPYVRHLREQAGQGGGGGGGGGCQVQGVRGAHVRGQEDQAPQSGEVRRRSQRRPRDHAPIMYNVEVYLSRLRLDRFPKRLCHTS